MKKILILTANPKDTDWLRLDKEVREIQLALERARSRDQFEIISRWAVRSDDFRRALLDHEPQIVHFSGHGAGSQGIALENDAGQMQLISTDSLAGLFKLFKDKIECVLLNACYSEPQAEAIHQHIKYVVGMNKAVGDRAAIKFAVGFYDALGAGRSIEFAFEMGRISIAHQSIPESSTPVIKVRDDDLTNIPESHESETVPPPTRLKRVFICYHRSQAPDRELARQFFEALNDAGHEAFMEEESILLGEDRLKRIDDELELSDYFLLLLSEQAAASEVVTKEVREAKHWRDRRIDSDQRPIILPIRVNFPMNSPLNHKLRRYLQDIQPRELKSLQDTPALVKEVVNRVSTEQIVIIPIEPDPWELVKAELLRTSRWLKQMPRLL